MMHTIRLREAWLNEPYERGVRHTRKFGLPTNITTERVYLVIENIAAGVVLNGKPLSDRHITDSTCRYEITGQLARRNELRITVETAAAGEASIIGEVRLEIDDENAGTS